jgi:response regulator RpfG family c-di-GMP phosphodiesterase
VDDGEVLYSVAQAVGNSSRGKILLVNDDAQDLEAYSSSLRQEGFEVRASVSYPEGLSCLESEQFDLVMVKVRKIPSLQDEESWSLKSRSPVAGLSCFWQAMTIGMVTWMWRTWELWTN